MLNAQLTQLLYVAEQLAVDVVFDFRHGRCSLRCSWGFEGDRSHGLKRARPAFSLADRQFGRHGPYDTPGMPPAVEKPAWDLIDTVLLDLDGTLLDLAFDNYFWREVIPAAYAISNSISIDAARAQ